MGDPTLRTIDGETGVLAWRAGRYRGRVGRHLRVYTMMQRVRGLVVVVHGAIGF
jgi:hypothetical protein